MNKLLLLFRSLPIFLALRLALFYGLKKLLNGNASIIYSQTGEDAIIRTLLDANKPGFYVDVGCHDPIKASNTFYLYLHGWRGINVDANERLIRKFSSTRRCDIAVCAAISDEEKEMSFYEFREEAVSTLSADILPEWKRNWSLLRERKVATRTLNSLLKEHFPGGVHVDLLTVDVEGHDLNVLRSIDLNTYRPRLIVVEMHHFDIGQAQNHNLVDYLSRFDYRLAGYATMNGYFVDSRLSAALSS